MPDLWFDIGQCQRNLGHARQATVAFEHYLSLTPDAADRGKVQAMIVQLGGRVVDAAADETASRATVTTTPPTLATPEAALAANAATTTARVEPSAPALAPAVTTLTASAPPPARSHRRRWLVWGGIAGGVVLGGVAIGLGVGLSETHASSATPALGSAATFDTRHR